MLDALTSFHSFLQVRAEYQGLNNWHISDALTGSAIRAPEFIRHRAETSVDRVSEDAVSIVQATMDRVWQAAGHRRSEVRAGELGGTGSNPVCATTRLQGFLPHGPSLRRRSATILQPKYMVVVGAGWGRLTLVGSVVALADRRSRSLQADAGCPASRTLRVALAALGSSPTSSAELATRDLRPVRPPPRNRAAPPRRGSSGGRPGSAGLSRRRRTPCRWCP